MVVTVTLRTLNEAKHIARFCQSYAWADHIIIADGGSTDNTLEIAATYKNVTIYHFDERVEMNGVWRNPEGRHLNFLMDRAQETHPDWIVHDDADSALTIALQEEARSIFEKSEAQYILLPRLYIRGTTQWYPRLTGGPQGYLNPDWFGYWAFRADVGHRWFEANPWSPDHNHMDLGPFKREYHYPPKALLHYFLIDDEAARRKFTLYRAANMVTPRWFEELGPLEELPEWARWS